MGEYSFESCIPPKHRCIFVCPIQSSDEIRRYWESSVLPRSNQVSVRLEYLFIRHISKSVLPNVEQLITDCDLPESLRQCPHAEVYCHYFVVWHKYYLLFG